MGCSKCRSASACYCNGYSSKPYYQCADVCLEDHSHTEYCHTFSPAVCPVNSWNVPVIGGSALLSVPGLKQAPVGAYLWNSQYGYFEITSASSRDETLGVVNNDTEGNVAPGTQIPECTCFIVTPPPVDVGDDSNVCVAVSFTAPAEDVPTDITITTTNGLTAGDTVEIGSGFYFIDQIKPDNIITIVNQGEGIVPGTAVIAQDANGNFVNCLSVLSTNVCDRDPISSGAVIACFESSTAPLDVTTAGDVLFGVNSVTDEAQFLPLDEAPPFCTETAVAVSVTAADPTYTITVDDTSGFAVDDVLVIEGRTDRAVVNGVTNATTMDITITPTPGANSSIPIDTRICQIGCCEELRNDLECVVQSLRLVIPAQNNTSAIVTVDGVFEVTLDANVIEWTAPLTCPGSRYHVKAEVNITSLLTYQNVGSSGTPVVTCELQCDWDNNVGVGGRINWNAGLGDTHTPYPASTLNAIWASNLQVNPGAPINYHGGYVIADTEVIAGATAALRLNFKCLLGDTFPPDAITGVHTYLIGTLSVTKIS